MQIIINLNEAETKALSHVAVDPAAWADYVIKERCRVAIDAIVDAEIKRRLEAGETISGSKEDIVLSAPIPTLAEIEAQRQAELEARLAQQ